MINVQTGAIIKTATQDYRGKLSEVLTEVIPEIAASLAKEQKTALKTEKTVVKDSVNKPKDLKKFGVTFKAGFAFLGYTSDANDAIAEYNRTAEDFGEYSDHRNLGLEISYNLSARWQFKLNLGTERMLTNWDGSRYFLAAASDITDYAHRFKFTNLGIGLNYYLLKRPAKFDWYVGADLGSVELNSHVTATTRTDEVFDKTYTYNAFAFKLATGCGYFFFKSFRLGLEFGLQGTGTFDLSQQQIMPAGDTVVIPNDLKTNIYLLKKFSAAGVLLNLTLGYHF
jgi:hypothetical protein